MTTVAIVVLVLAGLLIWGGLIVSVLLLRRDARGTLVDEGVEEVRDPYDVGPRGDDGHPGP
jgi:hypothetical protein